MRSGTATPLGDTGFMVITTSSIKDKMLLLTYRCADIQEATLFTSISPFQESFFTSPAMMTVVSSQKNMHAQATHITTFPLQVHWTLKKLE
jgi:hypothetical protein